MRMAEMDESTNIERLRSVSHRAVGAGELFQRVAEEYQCGKLTLGEAAELLGMNRYEYDAWLEELDITQEPVARTKEDVTLVVRQLEVGT